MTELDTLTDRAAAPRVEAVVAVEQARAVAQVAAAVQVAQQFPRDLDRIRAEVDAACRSYDLAAVAFYALPNRGQGMTVNVLAELAVIWGNTDAGVHELRRDDAAGMSEVQAFAWDVQRNSRHTRTFQVPHAVDASDGPRGARVKVRKPITDMLDVYRNNMSVGARAYRECVGRILPRWVTDGAERTLRQTLAAGPGKPLGERIDGALGWAQRVGVTRQQLEHRIGRPVGKWTPEDLAALEVVATSIGRGETTTAEQFDPEVSNRVTADELGDPGGTPPAAAEQLPEPPPEPVGDERPAPRNMITAVILALRDVGIEADEDQHAWLTQELHREVTTRNSLTRWEASKALDVLAILRADMPGADS